VRFRYRQVSQYQQCQRSYGVAGSPEFIQTDLPPRCANTTTTTTTTTTNNNEEEEEGGGGGGSSSSSSNL